MLPESLQKLPVITLADDIATALIGNNALLQAEPGAGKSTALPLALLLDKNRRGKIILLEPRRLAARLVASRLAWHLGEPVGQRIGLRMRGDTRVSDATELEVVTEGVLTRLLQRDPALAGTALIIFDEFHERSLHADLALALCLEVQRELRNDLRLLLMSATLQSDQIGNHLNGIKLFQCAVRQHPVSVVWVGESRTPLPQRIAQTVLSAVKDNVGDVLVFLPGVAEIRRCAELLSYRLPETVSVHPLHSGVGSAAQSAATAPAEPNRQRIILATSIAETSITIDGVRVVVDSGLERRGKVDSITGSQRLETVTASQASATQRMGRAGRTAAGVCYRLWSESGHARRAAHWQPEIRRVDLAPLLLELGLWGALKADELPWLEPPPDAGVSRAAALLEALGLWTGGQISARGRLVASLPVHPRLGHMLLWADRYALSSMACRLAVCLEEQQSTDRDVDLERHLVAKLPRSVQQRETQLMKSLAASSNQRADRSLTKADTTTLSPGVVLAQGFPDWIARKRPGQPGQFLLACGAGVILDSEHALAHQEWLAVAQLGGSGTTLRIFKAATLSIVELEQVSPEMFDTVDHIDWDSDQERVVAERRLMIGRIQVSAQPIQKISDNQALTALLAGFRRHGLSCLPWTDENRDWQARVMRLRELISPVEAAEWPVVDDDTLLATLEDWLFPWLQGIRSLKALQRLDLHKALSAMLDYPQHKQLEQWFPTRFQVPSGSNIKLRYVCSGAPVLSVRLQEMLGCDTNPSIAEGRVPLKVELLSPAQRPVQVTTDLVNFWRTSYRDVKKEMAGRYPKHVWPDDPLMAQPTAYAKRRKSS